VIENKALASTAKAADAGAKADPDDYTLAPAPAGQLTILPHLHETAAYDRLMTNWRSYDVGVYAVRPIAAPKLQAVSPLINIWRSMSAPATE